MLKIGLLLGSFDPPHIGHVAAYYYAQQFLDGVCVVPAFKNPWKEHKASYEDRVEMCKRQFPNTAHISTIEKDIKVKASYTYKVLEALKSKRFYNIDAEYSLILGEDEDPSKWKEGNWILKNFNIIRVPRGTTELGITVSSTLLRDNIKNNKLVFPYINIETLKYIKEHNLYVSDN